MALEDALVTQFQSLAGLTALVGSGQAARIYPAQAPQVSVVPGQAPLRFPRLIFEVVNEFRPMALGGGSGLVKAGVIVDCDGGDTPTGYADAKAVAEQVRQMHGFRGNMGTGGGQIFVNAIFVQDHRDDPDEPRHATEKGVQRVSLDLTVWFNESIPVTV